MSHIKNPDAYFRTVVQNLDKNDFRSNDNFYNHIDSVGDEYDIRRKLNQQTQKQPDDIYSVESALCDSSEENWLLLMNNERLHEVLCSLKSKEINFLFALSQYEYNCKKYADANGLSKQTVSNRFLRLRKKILEYF